jgi:hypothetical protein
MHPTRARLSTQRRNGERSATMAMRVSARELSLLLRESYGLGSNFGSNLSEPELI